MPVISTLFLPCGPRRAASLRFAHLQRSRRPPSCRSAGNLTGAGAAAEAGRMRVGQGGSASAPPRPHPSLRCEQFSSTGSGGQRPAPQLLSVGQRERALSPEAPVPRRATPCFRTERREARPDAGGESPVGSDSEPGGTPTPQRAAPCFRTERRAAGVGSRSQSNNGKGLAVWLQSFPRPGFQI